MKKLILPTIIILLFIIGLIVALKFLGEGWAAVLGLVGLGGSGVVSRTKKKARKKHEEVAKQGPGAIADDNLDMLKRHRSNR